MDGNIAMNSAIRIFFIFTTVLVSNSSLLGTKDSALNEIAAKVALARQKESSLQTKSVNAQSDKDHKNTWEEKDDHDRLKNINTWGDPFSKTPNPVLLPPTTLETLPKLNLPPTGTTETTIIDSPVASPQSKQDLSGVTTTQQ